MKTESLIDLIVEKLITEDTAAQRLADCLVDGWQDGLTGPGRGLDDLFGLGPRESQAWRTGGVSLLTIAEWRRRGRPNLDPAQPWYRLDGKPPHERVGYFHQRPEPRKPLVRPAEMWDGRYYLPSVCRKLAKRGLDHAVIRFWPAIAAGDFVAAAEALRAGANPLESESELGRILRRSSTSE